jgi:hypothetical protein
MSRKRRQDEIYRLGGSVVFGAQEEKLYTNQRVQEAAEKEKERLERIRRDEELRPAQLAKMAQEEVAASAMAGNKD